jgi:hypothetical protein
MGQGNCGIDACKCTTSIMDCIVHGSSEIAQKERELAGPLLTLVIAYNEQDFLAWCLDNNRNPRDPAVRFVRDEQSVAGMTGPAEVFITGRGYLRRDITRIRQWLYTILR